MPVKEVRGGQTASFALKKIKRSAIRKGMVMVSPALNPQACWEFIGEILVLHHPTTISPRYQAMVHCGSVRQTASILTMNKDCLRTGDKATVHFRFIKNPEYLRPNMRMVFREGRTKAVGNVLRLIPHAPPGQQLSRSKPNKMRAAAPASTVGATPGNDVLAAENNDLQKAVSATAYNGAASCSKKGRGKHRGSGSGRGREESPELSGPVRNNGPMGPGLTAAVSTVTSPLTTAAAPITAAATLKPLGEQSQNQANIAAGPVKSPSHHSKLTLA
jgi:hypothetical protein